MTDLLKYSRHGGGCSAKIPQDKLRSLLSTLTPLQNEKVLVDSSTGDDAGVYLLDEQRALILTTDFFPPICSDPYDFGQIAAANSLSDVYAMGGKPLLVLNLNLFPSGELPMEVLGEILKGGQDKINEAGAFVMGGHTIDDETVKYGLAVVGSCVPALLVTNSGAKVGQKLILTKPLGTGIVTTAKRLGLPCQAGYAEAIDQMKTLNALAGTLMNRYGVTGGTDITGFGLAGHLNRMAESSGVTCTIDCNALPLLPGVRELLQEGCIPGTLFSNLHAIEDSTFFGAHLSLEQKLICCDAQTSGGILMAVDAEHTSEMLSALKEGGASHACVIGEVGRKRSKNSYFI